MNVRTLSWAAAGTNSRNTILQAIEGRIRFPPSSTFFFFFSSFLVWIQLREQGKGSKNKRWQRHCARLVIYLSGDHVNSQAVHRGEPRQCQRDKSDRKRARKTAVRPCARPANVNEFTCFLRASFQTIVLRRNARETSLSFLLNLLSTYTCTSPI